MPISLLGQINVSALNVPQVDVQIVPPQFLYNGVPTNVCGYVGTASWGPVNTPMPFGSYSQYASIFGPTINRLNDMGGHIVIGQSLGAGYFCGVRITDGTDVAASAIVQTNCITWTAKYTGSLGNQVVVNIMTGTQARTYKVVITGPGLATETFDNLAYGATGNGVWMAIASAINNGSSLLRPASNIIIATAGVGTVAPALASVTLSGGTDGVSGLTGSTLSTKMIGVNTNPRTGMYALAGNNVAQFTLCDLYDLTTLPAQISFGTSIGAEVVMATEPSDTISNAATELSTVGVDSFVGKVLFGDWVVWEDTTNNIAARVTSPAAVSVGMMGNLSPQVSLLNKPVGFIWGTQSSVLGTSYTYSDFQNLALARMDVVCLDPTITNNFVHRLGINTSSNPITMGDEYTRVIFFLAKSIQIIGAQFLGANMTPSEMTDAKVALQEFLALQQDNGIIYTFDGSQAYQVVLDTTNNTQQTAALGYQYAYVKAIIGPIVRYFIINLEGGSSVTISEAPPT